MSPHLQDYDGDGDGQANLEPAGHVDQFRVRFIAGGGDFRL